MIEMVCATVFPGAMAAAGTMDLLTMTIPNRLSIVLVGAFFAVAAFVGVSPADIAIHTLTCLGVLAVGIFMFARGWVGGGDAKIFAAASLWVGFSMLGKFAVFTAIAGGILTIALLVFRRIPLPVALVRVGWIDRLHQSSTGVPYGIAIAAGAMMVYPDIPWVQRAFF